MHYFLNCAIKEVLFVYSKKCCISVIKEVLFVIKEFFFVCSKEMLFIYNIKSVVCYIRSVVYL